MSGTGAADPFVDQADQHFVVFRIAEGSFALRLDTVWEILRVPALARMPLAPVSLLGLANLRGAVLPVVSLRQLLGLPFAPFDPGTRVIVVGGDARVGFVVDRVERLTRLPASRVVVDAGGGDVDPELLDGVIMGAEGESATRILNPQQVLRGEFGRLGAPSHGPSVNAPTAAVIPNRPEAKSDQISLISFDLGRQEYALPLERVREIIPLPDHARKVAHAEAAVLGVVTLRDRLLPLVSLRTLLGVQNETPSGEGGRVVVVSIGSNSVGIVADRTREILRVGTDVIDPAPALLTRGTGEAEITSICRLDGGRRLVALLSPDQLFRADLLRRVLADVADDTVTNEKTSTHTVVEEQLIVFRLGDQEFGLPVEVVDEVARPPDRMTPVPRAPAFIDGVINLRGSVIPVVDLRRRFDLPGNGQRRSRRILVMAFGGRRTGFMVDSVSEILKVPAGRIFPAPQVSSDQTRLIGRVANLEAEGRLILLIDPAQLLGRLEADILAQFEHSDLAHAPAHS
jgi:purine-binding chemotaxis protein CheW